MTLDGAKMAIILQVADRSAIAPWSAAESQNHPARAYHVLEPGL
jgi:hypothetical protein